LWYNYWSLNKEKCDKDVDELNKPREAEELIYEECCKCRNDEYGSPDDIFRLRDVCKMASIKTDRNGDYCENDRSSYYSMKTDSYYVEETNIIE